MKERLQKILSAQGVASRRKAEEYIEQGLVKVNGKVATLGQSADPEVDTIEVDGKVLKDRQEMLYYVMNKPVGVETTNIETEASQMPTVRDVLPPALRGKIFHVGRLDKDSWGLLLFTNDGVIAYRLTHPSFSHEKEYEVTLDRPIIPLACRKIEEGFEMDGHRTKPLKCSKVAPNIIRITLTEGKNRQIRRMCQHVGFTVVGLRRLRIMTLTDDRLQAGKIRPLNESEKRVLLQSVGLEGNV